jgi:hypothetical protein
MLAAIAICPLAASTTCPLAVTVVAKRSLVAIVGAGGRVLDRHFPGVYQATEPRLIDASYRTVAWCTSPVPRASRPKLRVAHPLTTISISCCAECRWLKSPIWNAVHIVCNSGGGMTVDDEADLHFGALPQGERVRLAGARIEAAIA